MSDVFKMSASGLPKGARVVGFRGSEGLSRLYGFEVFLAFAPDEAASLDMAEAVNAKATLTLDRQDGRPPFAFHGILSDVALVHHERDGYTLLRALLVPRLWQLTQTLHSRVFTKLSIPDILKLILDKAGQDYQLKLTQQYAAEEHVCQYGESDFDFISRWMEREGMVYFFEQGDDGEKLVIADATSAHEDLSPAPVRFFAHMGSDVSAKECLHTFVCRRRSLPAGVRLQDYDYGKPKLDVSGSAPVSTRGKGEIRVHGARFFSPDDGKRLAKLRAEEMLAREVVFTGTGNAFHLRTGYTFALQDHPWPSFDAKYLATEAEHYGNQAASTPELKAMTGLDRDEVYRVDVTAIPASVQFRAEARTTWPRIYGTEHGVVDGEADHDYAQLDEHGRYAVRFAFDESDLGAGKASTRVRMMQPHGGDVEGWHFPLRKGTEVLFTFLGGDPDRPVIAGVVPNAINPSAVTNGNHTKNVIQTGGRNRFELEDKEGQQRITLSTPHQNSYIRMGAPNADHTMIIKTDGPTLLDAGQDWDVDVGAKLTEHVKGPVKETYDSGQETTIKGGRTEKITSGGFNHNILGTYDFYASEAADEGYGSTLRHSVLGKVSQNWGSLHLYCGPVDQELGKVKVKAGDAELIYGKVHASTGHILVDAPTVKVVTGEYKVSVGFWKGFSGPSLEGFTTKNAVGLQSATVTGLKIDSALVSMAANGMKVEATKLAMSRTGVKIDIADVKGDNKSLGFEQVELKTSNAAIRLLAAGLTVLK
jgi:type VI secretion system secreted protein VgrG